MSSLIVLVRDLIFSSRISATAKAENILIELVRDPLKLNQSSGNRLIVDLNLEGALTAAVQWQQRTGGEVVGFVSHTDRETIQRAQDSGITRVLPRSRFVEDLPAILHG